MTITYTIHPIINCELLSSDVLFLQCHPWLYESSVLYLIRFQTRIKNQETFVVGLKGPHLSSAYYVAEADATSDLIIWCKSCLNVWPCGWALWVLGCFLSKAVWASNHLSVWLWIIHDKVQLSTIRFTEPHQYSW